MPKGFFLKRLHIYRYRDGEKRPLCIFLCNTAYDNKIVIVPLVPIAYDSNCICLSNVNQYANLSDVKEIDSKQIINPLYLKSKHVGITQSEFVKLYKTILHNQIENIHICAKSCISDTLDTFEKTYNFLSWQLHKYDISTKTYSSKLNIFENGIYWADLGYNIGSELNKRRPVLIWKKRENTKKRDASSYIVIPITSKHKKKNYYMNVEIELNNKKCYLRIEDMKRINIRRIVGPVLDDKHNILFIDEPKREDIKNAISQFYIFDNQHKNNNQNI